MAALDKLVIEPARLVCVFTVLYRVYIVLCYMQVSFSSALVNPLSPSIHLVAHP